MSQPYTIKMPQLSDTMTEGVVVSWEKNIGDRIERGDIVATVETDKAIMDVEVFREGYLSGPRAAVDSVVLVGGALAYLVASANEVVAEAGAAPVASGDEEASAAPAAASASAAPQASAEPEGVTHIIKMPQLSDTMTEGVVVEWQKQVGDKIERGDIVASVETDKAIMDVEVFREGFLSGPLAEADSVIPVGAAMGYLVEARAQVQSGAMAPVAAAAAEPQKKKKTAASTSSATTAGTRPASRPKSKLATPYARKLAGETGVDLNMLAGSGPRNVIVGADVHRTAPVVPAGAAFPVVEVPGAGRPMTSLERNIAQAMSGALSMPTFRVSLNAQPTALISAAKKAGISVSVAIARACALAMQKHPNMNWAYQPVDKLVERANVDIGVAVAADDGGLVVPILRNCESRTLAELNADWSDLVPRARKRRLKPVEFQNPTFMVSNMGMLGVTYFDAIPTPGTAAILAISSADERGMPLTITADHRVVNGADVAMYLNTLKQYIEQPDGWMGAGGPAIPAGNWNYDVVIIGGGPGGEDCARELVEHGLKVAMINDAPFPGGECLWRGCIPSKAWRAAADRIRDRVHDARLGIKGTTTAKLDWKMLEKTRRGVLETRGAMALKTDTSLKIKFIQGFARFENDHTVFVDTSGNQKDPHARAPQGAGKKGQRITFGCAVIATGAPPFVPPIPGAAEGLKSGGVLTSDTVWFLKQAPKKLAIVGGGAIGVEMAQIFQDFGAQVTLVEVQERILAEVEPEVAKNLATILNDDPRLTVHTAAKVEKISGKPGRMELTFKPAEGRAKKLAVDYVIMATGKRPVLDPLNLAAAGVAIDKGVINADASCRTSMPHIFAVGDVIGGYMLAHTAGQQGRVAAATISGESAKYDQDKDCGVIFTRPQAAFVGLSVAQAKQKNIDAVEVKMPMSIDAKAMITGETLGMIKLVADKASRRIIGVHFLTDHADTLIGEAVMMVAGQLTLDQVAHAIHPHPTQTELFGEMARRLLSRLRRSQKIAVKK